MGILMAGDYQRSDGKCPIDSIWGLALGGEDGVRDVLLSLLADLDLTMALSGRATVDEVDGSLLA